MILLLVKNGMRNSTVSALVNKGQRIINCMTNNPYFENPTPSLAEFTAITEALCIAEQNMDGARLHTEQRNSALATFKAAVVRLQNYVEVVANGNHEIILSSGFELRNPPTKTLLPPAPLTLNTLRAEITGEIILKWETTHKAKISLVEYTLDPINGPWISAGQSSRSKFVAKGLQPGQLYYFRVAQFNTAGMGPWSTITSAHAAH